MYLAADAGFDAAVEYARRWRPDVVLHDPTSLEGLLAAYGLQVNRDLVVDRGHNGRMSFPVRQGRRVEAGREDEVVVSEAFAEAQGLLTDEDILDGLG